MPHLFIYKGKIEKVVFSLTRPKKDDFVVSLSYSILNFRYNKTYQETIMKTDFGTDLYLL